MHVRYLLILLLALCLSACKRPQAPIVVVDPPSVALEVDSAGVHLEPGLTARVKVKVVRTNMTDSLKLELRNLPAGLSATPVNVQSHEKEALIELTAAPTVVPGEKTGVQAFASAGDVEGQSFAFRVNVAKPSITCVFEPTQLKIPRGESRKLKVTIQRGRDAYQGPVVLSLDNLPKNVDATAMGNGPEGAEWAVFSVKAGADAIEGETQPIVRIEGDKQLRSVALFPLTIQGDPFLLKAEPTRVNGVFGQSTKVKITATRRDYQGPITIQLNNLPAHVKSKSITLPARQTTGEIDLIVANDAISMDKAVQIQGTADDARRAAGTFDLKIEGRPFTLSVQPARLDVVQGTSAKFKVIALRAKDYTGPIELDFRKLPFDLKISPATIPAQGKDVEVHLSAGDIAALGQTSGIEIVGTAQVAGQKREIVYDKFALGVLSPFSLVVQPARIEMVEGQKAIVKIQAVRRTYNGAIDVEMRNLPLGVTAPKVEIPLGQNSVDVELTADLGTSGKIKPNAHAFGIATNKKQIASNQITVAVLSKLFELKLDKSAKVTFGGKTLVKVTAQRKDYDGPIALEMKNLSADLKAEKVVLPAGKNEIELEIAAIDQAKEATTEAHVLGTATNAGNQQRTSNNIAVQVVPGLFDLKLDTTLLQLHHGGAAKVTVIAQRKGHDGPIVVELKNLPMKTSAEKVTIPQGENRVEVEIKAQLTVNEGAKVDVFARGSAQSKTVDSSRFTVNIGSVGQAPRFVLKVEPATIKLGVGETVKVKVTTVRKDYAGPIAVELRNLPAEVESSKGMIAADANVVEITLTARAKAEVTTRIDVCAVGLAVAVENQAFASPQVMLQVGRK